MSITKDIRKNKNQHSHEVNFIELLIKFANICTTRAESPRTILGMSSAENKKLILSKLRPNVLTKQHTFTPKDPTLQTKE